MSGFKHYKDLKRYVAAWRWEKPGPKRKGGIGIAHIDSVVTVFGVFLHSM